MALNVYASGHRYPSLPFSSFFIASKLKSSQRTIFLSCNDVISIDFRLFIHDSIIVKYDIKSKYPEEYSTIDKEGSEKLLARQGSTFRKKSWSQLKASKFSFLVARTSILVA